MKNKKLIENLIEIGNKNKNIKIIGNNKEERKKFFKKTLKKIK